MLLDLSFSNTSLYQASFIVFRESSCCSKERYLNITKQQNQLLYMFDVVKKEMLLKFIVKYYNKLLS